MRSYRKELWFKVPGRRAFINVTGPILHEVVGLVLVQPLAGERAQIHGVTLKDIGQEFSVASRHDRGGRSVIVILRYERRLAHATKCRRSNGLPGRSRATQ